MARRDEPKSLVPDAFQLAGIRWRVVETPHMTELGKCERDTATIHLLTGLDPQIRAGTFCHELVHAIRFATGDAGPHDEREVEAFAAFLHQFLTTRA